MFQWIFRERYRYIAKDRYVLEIVSPAPAAGDFLKNFHEWIPATLDESLDERMTANLCSRVYKFATKFETYGRMLLSGHNARLSFALHLDGAGVE